MACGPPGERYRGASKEVGDGNDEVPAASLEAEFAATARLSEPVFALESLVSDVQDEDHISLLECSICIARCGNPALDAAAVRAQVDEMARQLLETLPPYEERHPLRVIKCINEYLYDTCGFAGDTEDYYNPANSYVDQVLARRRGIPISLAILYMELAARCGLDMVGVNFPSHFMVRPRAGAEFLVDVFGRGEVLFVEDVEQRFGEHMARQRGAKVQIDRSFFEDGASHKRTILTRCLQNLKATYMSRTEHRDPEKVLLLCRMQDVAAPPYARPKVRGVNLRDRGIANYNLGRLSDARDCLAAYQSACPGASDAPMIGSLLKGIERQIDGPPPS